MLRGEILSALVADRPALRGLRELVGGKRLGHLDQFDVACTASGLVLRAACASLAAFARLISPSATAVRAAGSSASSASARTLRAASERDLPPTWFSSPAPPSPWHSRWATADAALVSSSSTRERSCFASPSASRLLTTGERTGFLDAVDQQVAQGTTGVEFLPRGPITVTGRRAELPVTLVNSRPSETTVAVELTSHRLRVTEGEPLVFTLQPGRNNVAVPVVSTSPGSTLVTVLVTTPDEAGAITLATGTFSVRFADVEGIGLLILVLAAGLLAAWWLQTLRKRTPDADGGGATVTSPGSVGDNAQTSTEAGTPSNRRAHEDMT